VAAGGCGADEQALRWSVRRGQVGEFAVRGGEVFTVGRETAVYDAAGGGRLRGAPLPADLADVTAGQLGPGLAVVHGALAFGWYDFASETGTVVCVDAATLRSRWQWQIRWPWRERSLRPTVAVTADERHVYAAAVGKDGDNVFAFHLADGRRAWSRAVETFPVDAALALAGPRLLVRSQLWARTSHWHEQLDALHVDDGRRLWRTWLTGEAKHHPGGPLVDGDHVYTTTRAGVASGRLFTIRLADGHTTRDDVATSGAPIARRGSVIAFGGWPPLAYDVAARRTVWRTTLGYAGDAAPPMIAGGAVDAAGRHVVTGDSQRHVYVLSADTGALTRRIRLDTYHRFELLKPLKGLFGSYGVRRLALHAGRLYVGTVDASLFVFRQPPD
jgi:outer membrane protein assembly factor BamB